jgi:hypothetical protein
MAPRPHVGPFALAEEQPLAEEAPGTSGDPASLRMPYRQSKRQEQGPVRNLAFYLEPGPKKKPSPKETANYIVLELV